MSLLNKEELEAHESLKSIISSHQDGFQLPVEIVLVIGQVSTSSISFFILLFDAD